MAAGYTTPIDISNRGLQHLGASRIATFSDASVQAQETAFAYDKLRQAELRRSVWRFALRRATLRKITTTTKRFLAPAWASGGAYVLGSIVQNTFGVVPNDGVYWVCMIAHTAGATNAPGVYVAGQPQFWQQYFGPVHGDAWSGAVNYNAGELVYVASSPDAWYLSLINKNLNNVVGTAADWAPVVSTGTTDYPINFLIPAGINGDGTAVTVNGRARNIYPLPNGFLRAAPPDPRVENAANNVTSAALRFLDLEFENGFIVSAGQTIDPIILRFVSDISDVTQFDPLFCEGLAARIGYECCERVTGSNVKLQAVGMAYQKFIQDARLVNQIEVASTEPMEAEYELTKGPAGVNEAPGAQGGAEAQQSAP